MALQLMVIARVAAVSTFRRERKANPAEKAEQMRMWQALLVVSAAATFLMLRVSGFAWTLLPKLRFVQFPWRWMLILAVPCAVFVGACAAKRLGALWIVLTLATSAL